ncbi:hypothetical protein K1719_021433 [Acacia pycnantha]|nr:hypothetical protein K1719_021433 [Acacia pycnantha]
MPCATAASAAANGVGVVPPMLTAALDAKANVASPTSSPGTPSNRCSCTARTLSARPEASTPTTPSFKPPSLSRPLPPPAIMPRTGGRLQLSSAKLPTRPTAIEQHDRSTYCAPSDQYPCAPGKRYYGRGPIQLKWNYNYGQAGTALGVDLLNNPDLVATDPVLSFKVALWFWMTPQSPKPSCHDVITGRWTPSAADVAAGRLPGYGVVTNIIIGGLECGKGPDSTVDENRIGYFKRYCDMLGLGYGDNLNCSTQRPFGYSSLIDVI